MTSNTIFTIIPARQRYNEKKPIRETVIRIKIKEIVDGITLVHDYLPESAEKYYIVGFPYIESEYRMR
jgi:hypothetical protein